MTSEQIPCTLTDPIIVLNVKTNTVLTSDSLLSVMFFQSSQISIPTEYCFVVKVKIEGSVQSGKRLSRTSDHNWRCIYSLKLLDNRDNDIS